MVVVGSVVGDAHPHPHPNPLVTLSLTLTLLYFQPNNNPPQRTLAASWAAVIRRSSSFNVSCSTSSDATFRSSSIPFITYPVGVGGREGDK